MKGKVAKILKFFGKGKGKFLSGKFGGWDLIKKPFEYPNYLSGEKLVSNNLKSLSKKIDDMTSLAKLNKLSRKDIFFRSKLANTKGYSSLSFIESRKKYWEKINSEANSDVGLKVLHEVLGNKEKSLKTLLSTPKLPVSHDDWFKSSMKRMDAEQKLKEINDLNKKVKSYFRRFSKSPPIGRHLKDLKNFSRQNLADHSSKAKNLGILKDFTNQGNEIEFARGNVGQKIKNLKKLRKAYAIENTLPVLRKSAIDYKVNKRAEGVIFRRVHGRLVMMRIKK